MMSLCHLGDILIRNVNIMTLIPSDAYCIMFECHTIAVCEMSHQRLNLGSYTSASESPNYQRVGTERFFFNHISERESQRAREMLNSEEARFRLSERAEREREGRNVWGMHLRV